MFTYKLIRSTLLILLVLFSTCFTLYTGEKITSFVDEGEVTVGLRPFLDSCYNLN